MRNIKLTIEYDGTGYHGWQSQINAAAVQDVVSSAVKKLTGEEIGLSGSSRTDTGVHALGQVANFFTASKIPADKFAFAINTMLPEDIVIRRSEEVHPEFHSRFSAKGKKYRYLIYNSAFPTALLRHRAWHVVYRLDPAAMEEGAGHFLGTHDFKAFMATGSSAKTTVRTISSISVNVMSAETGLIYKETGTVPVYNRKKESYTGTVLASDLASKETDSAGRDMGSTDSEMAFTSGQTQKNHPPVFLDYTDREPTFTSDKIPENHLLVFQTDKTQENRPLVSQVALEIAGDGFLYNMVRIIAGTLVQVGYGKIKPEDVPAIIEGGDRKKAGKTAPAHGLYLVEVYY